MRRDEENAIKALKEKCRMYKNLIGINITICLILVAVGVFMFFTMNPIF